jgi:hypothetical protein
MLLASIRTRIRKRLQNRTMEEIELEEVIPKGVPICKRPGCGKVAWPGKAYCSHECTPQGRLPTEQKGDHELQFEERRCAQNCGKTFRVLSTSKQMYCSSLCQALFEGKDPLKGQDWHGSPGTKVKPQKPDKTSPGDYGSKETKETEAMPIETTGLSAAELARKLKVKPYQIYYLIKSGKIQKSEDGFDLEEAKRVLGESPPSERKRRAPIERASPIAAPRIPRARRSGGSWDAGQVRARALQAATQVFRDTMLKASKEAEGDTKRQLAILKDYIETEARLEEFLRSA